MEQLNELGYYTLAGNSENPLDCVTDSANAERLGIGVNFLSERFNFKEGCSVCGALAASTTTSGIATAATNANTRNPMATASFCVTMNRLSKGRFALGLGSGIPNLMKDWGLKPNTMERTTDYVDLIRRLTRGETILDHEGPAGNYKKMHLLGEVNDEVPIMSVAIGEKVIEWAGGIMDGIVLHTFFTDETLARVVKLARQGAEKAGRDPDKLRIWSILSIVNDNLTHDQQLLKVVARMGTYLQLYGDILVKTNRWDPEVLKKFKNDKLVANLGRWLDDLATTKAELEHVAELIPDEWVAAAGIGSPANIAKRIVDQFDNGADGVIMHGVRPDELENVIPAYRATRPSGKFKVGVANPGK